MGFLAGLLEERRTYTQSAEGNVVEWSTVFEGEIMRDNSKGNKGGFGLIYRRQRGEEDCGCGGERAERGEGA